MNPYPVSVSFDLDRAEDRAALTWLSQCRSEGFKTYSAAVVAVINDYRDRKERLSADPYLETRGKEDAFLQRVLETIRQGMGPGHPVPSPPVQPDQYRRQQPVPG